MDVEVVGEEDGSCLEVADEMEAAAELGVVEMENREHRFQAHLRIHTYHLPQSDH